MKKIIIALFIIPILFLLISCSENKIEKITKKPEIQIKNSQARKEDPIIEYLSDEIVVKYYYLLSKNKTEEAYKLKNTDLSLKEFEDIYSDFKRLKLLKKEKLENNIFRVLTEIDLELYQAELKVIDGKIKTLKSNKLENKYYDKQEDKIKNKGKYLFVGLHRDLDLNNLTTFNLGIQPYVDGSSYSKMEFYIYTPIKEGENMKFDFWKGIGRFGGYSSDFSLHELAQNQLKTKGKGIGDSFLTTFDYDVSNNTKIDLGMENINNKNIYSSTSSEIPGKKCNFYTERLNKDFLVLYIGCGNVNEIDNVSYKTKEELLKTIPEVPRDYINIGNGETIEIPYQIYSDLRLECDNVEGLPVMECMYNYFENYGEYPKLVFKKTKKYIDFSEKCDENSIEYDIDNQLIKVNCHRYQGEDELIVYDINGDKK